MVENGSRRQIAAALTLCAFILIGSGALQGCKAKEVKSTDTTTAEMMDKDPEVPFHKTWHKPDVDLAKYKRLYVAPVNTEYMLQQTEWQKGQNKEQIEAGVQELAKFTRETVEKDFREDPNHRFEVIAEPSKAPDTLIFEIALTEVIPSKVVLNHLGYVPFGIGLSIRAVRTVAADQSSVAFEARVSDASTREIILMAADRQSDQFSPISVRGLTWYSHAETMIEQWSKQFVLVANRKSQEVIKDAEPFTLKPW
jgi:hypothetical protein